MNQAIATIIKTNIQDLDFVDKIAGLTSVALMTITDEAGAKTEKRLPIACCTTADDCKTGAYNDLCPDSRYKSVIYFEDQGVSFVKYEGNYKYYQSNLRLVCWLNVAKLREEPCHDGTVCTLSSKAITQIIRALPRHPEHRPPFVNVYSEVTEQLIRSSSIFGGYTYNEKQTQYLMYPYDYFALTIRTSFSICLSGTDYYEPCDPMILDLTPTAIAGTGTCNGFIAKWNNVVGAGGYFLDISTQSDFSTFIYEKLDVGHVTAYQIEGLNDATTYYYRVKTHTGIVVSDPSNVISVKTLACDWFLPSSSEVMEMFRQSIIYGGWWWSSTEMDDDDAFAVSGSSPLDADGWNKSSTINVRACRKFISPVGSYSLGDTGPAGGKVFYITGTTVYEAAPTNQSNSKEWSNIVDVAIGTTSGAIGEGLNNTDEIIAQPGHIGSAAKLCKDLAI